MGKLVKQAPTTVIVCGTVLLVALIASTTWLIMADKDPSGVSDMVGKLIQAVSAIASGGALLYAGSAASSAHAAKEQTNGVLDKRMRDVFRSELAAAGVGSQADDEDDASLTKGH